MTQTQYFHVDQSSRRSFTWGDVLAFILIVALLYVGTRLAVAAPETITGPTISLAPRALPWYAALSVGRMTASYTLSLLFTLVYGRIAAYNHRAEQVMVPLLDVLQSVPILSFLPVVLLSLSAILPENAAAEIASIVLIFTSQVWNMTFAWFQSLTTIPKELREASSIFRLNNWMQFRTLELPFAAISLVWNSMMSWAGGWFFLMAAESFTVGQRDFRLPGLGSYLHEAANQENFQAIFWGVATLVLVIVLLDQFIWRPLLAWSDRFKVEMVEDAEPPTSWFYNAWRSGRLADFVGRRLVKPFLERVDGGMVRRFPVRGTAVSGAQQRSWPGMVLTILIGAVLLMGLYRAGLVLLSLPLAQWQGIGLGLLATLLRVLLALAIALAWTVPVGVAIGTNRRLATILQPLVQIAASIPATALFPVLLLFILSLPAGLNMAAVLLMLLGTQWYLLFNIIAGASTIPQDLKYTSSLLHLSRWDRWRTLILPALFPFLVTGAITAGGGAWNASIVAEYVEFGGQTLHVVGIGAIIAEATANGDYALLLAATLNMVLAVVLINRLVWRRLYVLAEEKYRME
ncbi:MAG: ABC transporter permease subunit [Chloroflexi bacterium]|nr:ABC transporter permease subunit [Ardenticatenaceae bacterium]MBL1128597.1 ABC transporter permease subunit [Chloroflexota bacterium]NOG34676.1 ABC transporter permease subunit [Chloroflexota bacterium]GIK57738.1 MAG: ABC transporter permease [Chloroflexota bacterium]